MGRAVSVQYPDGKEVSYTYGKSGERTGITYPDGRKVSYEYDSLLRLSGLNDGSGVINYAYDEIGRLTRKTFPNGMETAYAYNEEGFLSELVHRDSEGILDRYAYRYDLMGNKTTIEKQRRGLPEESGSYDYGYDALGRLNTVAKNGENLRTYEYDAFGNRSLLKEGNKKTVYAYNAMNQLISRVDVMNEESYTYDKRGNLSLIMENGALKNRYTYGAINRIEQAVNGKGDSALYAYNGLGHRTGRETNRGREDYLIDLTRPYHNMLMMTDAEKSRTFYWDGNVSAMSESRKEGTTEISVPDRATDRIASGAYEITPIFHYYLQDDLGSPLRVSGYNTNTDIKEDGYLTYGYDEFGNDLYDSLYNDMEEAGIPNPYSRQGEEQPFGYTGYRRDDISGTYFAQAREYQSQNGRFISKDKEKFYKAALPSSWNLYCYCAGNSLRYVDPQGNELRENIETLSDYLYAGIDEFGLSIGLYWLYGNGEDLNIYSDATSFCGPNDWQIYMQDNAILTGKVGDVVIPIGESLDNGESVEVDMNMSMIIDNGEGAIGYQFLHGTDATVGGFQISGSISRDNKGNITYDLTYTWNDIMNPNDKYDTDVNKANAAQSIPFANPTDYNFHLSWHDKTIIKSNPWFLSRNSGWLKDYSSDWQDNLSKEDEKMLKMINNQQIGDGALAWPEQLQEIYETYSSYYDCEVLD